MPVPFQPRFVDLVRNLTTTNGTGNFVLGAAVSGFTSFIPAILPGESFYYSTIGIDKPAEREVGRGTMQANGTISRDPINGLLTSFTGGAKSIALIAAAEWFNAVQASSGSGGGSGAAASRTALAALTTQALPVILLEPGREGLFTFDSSNLSTKVTADSTRGIYVAPSASPSGALGAWVRQFSGPIDIRWFGAVADCTAVGVGTNNAAAINAAVTVAGIVGNCEIFIPRGRWRVGSRLSFTQGIKITGEGFHENPGIAGGVTFAGVNVYDGSILVFDANTPGMIFYEFTDGANAATVQTDLVANGVASIYYQYKSARYSVVRDLMLYGGGGTTVTAHGIEARTIIRVDNVRCDTFAGSGFHVDASTSTNTTPFGNADGSKFTRCIARANKLHGFRTRGNDANVMTFDGCDSANNGGAGYLDASEFGSTYTCCHAATNNQSYGLGTSATTQAQADSSQLGTSSVGSYITTGPSAGHVFTGCYSESSGGGTKAHLVTPTTVIGGNLASAGGTTMTAASTAKVFGLGFLANIDSVTPTTGSTFAVNSNLEVTRSVDNAVLALNPGSSTFSNLQMKGAGGSIANGLDLLAGSAAAYLSSDSFTFRNAPQTTNFLSLSAASAVFNGAVSGSNLSGTNSGDQTIALTGDVTGSGTGSFAATIGANKVTFAKFVAAGAASIVGATAAGNFAELTPASARSVLGLATIATSGSGADLTAATVTYAKLQNVSATSKLLGRASGGAGAVEELGLANGLTMAAGNLDLGNITPTSVVTAGALTSSGTAGNGYSAGAGGAVTQTPNKSSGVTLNKICGRVTMNNASLATSASVSFTLTNSTIAATDVVVANIASAGAANSYLVTVDAVAAGSCRIHLRNISAGALGEALVLNFAVMKSVIA